MVTVVLDLEPQFLSESRVKGLQRKLVRAGEAAETLACATPTAGAVAGVVGN
jgi:hypothetical protein